MAILKNFARKIVAYNLIRRQISRLRVFLNSYGAMARIQAVRPILKQLPPSASTYVGLNSISLLFESVSFKSTAHRSVNLLLPSLEESAMFAGSHTAIEFAQLVAQHEKINLRVLTTDPVAVLPKAAVENPIQALSLKNVDKQLVVSVEELKEGSIVDASPNDLWIATHWSTAHAVDVAIRCDRILSKYAIYLVQDYEPGFSAWSTDHALSSSTYHAGLTLAVNSKTLANYIEKVEGINIPESHIFGPSLPKDRLSKVASERSFSGRIGILFYARPMQLRNLFPIGVATLRKAVELLEKDALICDWFSAGEPHPDLWLSESLQLMSLGDVGYKGYWNLLQKTHVGLALMYSPHPSHLPLELAISGARAVTNSFYTINKEVHPRLSVAAPDPDALAVELVKAIRAAQLDPIGAFEPIEPDIFGGSIEKAVEAVLKSIKTK